MESREKSEEIIATLEKLVSFKTIDGNFAEFHKVVDFIENFFKNSKVYLRKMEFNGYPALYISTRSGKTPHIMLQGHLDVVSGDDEQFIPTRKGELLFGRGTVDMKGFDALALHLLKDIADSENSADIALALTFDEEIGGENGAKRLAEEGYIPQLLINGDGGYNYAVIHGEKGILKVKMSADSKPGRHPYPWDGLNAFDLLLRDYLAISNFFDEHEHATETDNWYTTYSAYDVMVENRPSFAPHRAEMKLNIYFTENMSVDELYGTLKNKIKYVNLEKISASERVWLNKDDVYILMLKEIMEKKFSRKISLVAENGSSDARFYADKNIPIVIVKMVGEDHHGPDEYLHMPSVLPMYLSIKDFIEKVSEKNNEKKAKSLYAV